MAAEWFTAVRTVVLAAGTLVLAVVAIFQDTVRGWFYKPTLEVSIKTGPPDCVAVPMTSPDGAFIANAYYLRLWVKNSGSTTAKNIEVYASELKRIRADNITKDIIEEFAPMNLRWANVHVFFFHILSQRSVGIVILGTSSIPPSETTPPCGKRTQGSNSPISNPHWRST